MLESIRRKLERRRRDVARAPLVYLLQWVAAHAVDPYVRVPARRDLVTLIEHDIGERLRGLADAGAFLFFGIPDAAAFGDPGISLRLVEDGRHPLGTVALVAEPLVAWILSGGAGASGWRSPGRLTLADLG